MRIFLNGYYGFSNLGDEALLWTILRAINAHCPEKPEYLIRAASPMPLPPEMEERCQRVGNNLSSLIAAARSSALTLFGGGSQFQDHGRLRNLRYFIKPLLIAFAAKKVCATGVSIGPLESVPGRLLANILLGLMGSILTRDQNSYEWVQRLGRTALISPDICFSDYLVVPPMHTGTKRRVGLSLLPWGLIVRGNKQADQAWLSVWSSVLGKMAAEYPDLVFLGAPFQRGIDSDPLFFVLSNLPEHQRQYADLDNGPEEALNELNYCTHFVAMRFHALVFAALLDKPTLILDYHPKVRLLAEELGFSPMCILNPTQWHDSDIVRNSLKNLIDEPSLYKPRTNINEIRQCARKQLDLSLQQCLSHCLQ